MRKCESAKVRKHKVWMEVKNDSDLEVEVGIGVGVKGRRMYFIAS